MDKEDMAYAYNGILLSHKKKEILPFATTWMDLNGIMLSEISQTEKDKYCIISLTWTLKTKQTNKNPKKTQAHRYREQIDGCKSGGWGCG